MAVELAPSLWVLPSALLLSLACLYSFPHTLWTFLWLLPTHPHLFSLIHLWNPHTAMTTSLILAEFALIFDSPVFFTGICPLDLSAWTVKPTGSRLCAALLQLVYSPNEWGNADQRKMQFKSMSLTSTFPYSLTSFFQHYMWDLVAMSPFWSVSTISFMFLMELCFLTSCCSGTPSAVSNQMVFFITVATHEYIIFLYFQHFLPLSFLLDFLSVPPRRLSVLPGLRMCDTWTKSGWKYHYFED